MTNPKPDPIEILRRVAELGPDNGTYAPGIACPFCDMGDAGYSVRGDGYHDDDCPVKDAQEYLKGLNNESYIGN